MISQIMLAVFGVTAIWLTQQPREELKKYACLFGMAAQPFWFYSTYAAGQWGIFALCVCYTYAWWLGIKGHWLIGRANDEQVTKSR
jgi:hypothetical protein